MKRNILSFDRRVVCGVRTVDGPIYAPQPVSDAEIERRVAAALRRRTQDDLLNAVNPGKVLALGKVWTGSLAPEIDARLDAIRPLVTGFTSGRVLNAEPASPSLDLGRKWVGDVVGMLRAAARDSETGEGEKVDLTEVARSASHLERAFERGNPDLITAAYGALRRDFDGVRQRHADDRRRTADAAVADRGAREAQATRSLIQDINSRNRAFYSGRDANGTVVGTRDFAQDMPGASGGKSFYSGGQPRPVTGSPFINGRALRFGGTPTPSIAEINRRNAQFWASRNGNGPKDAA